MHNWDRYFETGSERTNEAPNGQIVIVHLKVKVIRHCLRAACKACQGLPLPILDVMADLE